jgi:NAD-dependent DNA ligase
MKGFVFVIAGVAAEQRKQAITMIRQCGGSIGTSVSFKTTHLVLAPSAYGCDAHASALTKGMCDTQRGRVCVCVCVCVS